MILPGHLAASWLCHRHLKLDLKVVLLAGFFPDVVDKTCHYLLRIVPSSRLPMHTLWGWALTTLAVWGIGHALHHDRRWGLAWGASYAAHLLCDSLLTGDSLPFLYPLLPYRLTATPEFFWTMGPASWPWPKLLAEALLVAITLLTSVPGLRWPWLRRASAEDQR
jgi:hypothetical protein